MENKWLNGATALLVRHYSHQLKSNPTGIVSEWISHKIRHTYGVLYAVQQIMARERIPISKEVKKSAEIASLLHDIGRFHQHNGYRILTGSEYPHWDKGFEILMNEGFTNLTILFGVKYHDKLDLSGLYSEPLFQWATKSEQEEIVFVARLVRDADKLQNLIYCLYDDGTVFAKLSDNKNGIVKSELIDMFLSGNLVDNRMVETHAEKILNMWSWVHDINFESTMTLLGNDFNSRMLRLFKMAGADEQSVSKISKFFEI